MNNVSAQSVFNLPNLISLFRLLLAAPLAYALVYGYHFLATTAIILAGISDWADGFVARRMGLQTPLGAWLDPLSDKIVLNTTFITLAFLGYIPFWLAFILLIRDLVIVTGAFVYYKIQKKIEGSANVFGKISTVLQFGLVTWYVLFPDITVSLYLLLLITAVTVGSGLLYVDIWSRLTLQAYTDIK